MQARGSHQKTRCWDGVIEAEISFSMANDDDDESAVDRAVKHVIAIKFYVLYCTGNDGGRKLLQNQ